VVTCDEEDKGRNNAPCFDGVRANVEDDSADFVSAVLHARAHAALRGRSTGAGKEERCWRPDRVVWLWT
jgi:hypothetical protein